MAFRAVFEDGPLAGPEHERTMMAPSVPERLYFVPQPWDQFPRSGDGWIVVGMVPGVVPDPPWPGQEEYVLDVARTDVDLDGEPGADWGTAVYVHVDPVEMRG